VFAVGETVILLVVAAVDHNTVPAQLDTVSVMASPPHVVSLEAVIEGVGDAVFIETFTAFDAVLTQKLTVQVAVKVIAAVGVTVIEDPAWLFDQVIVPPVQPVAVRVIGSFTQTIVLLAEITGAVVEEPPLTLIGCDATLVQVLTLQIAV
jgi:hypothetical protein